MSFTIYLGKFSKRVNSTKRPDLSGFVETSAVWKREKDIDSPTLLLSLGSETPHYNYMYIPFAESYYWITGIVSTGAGRWEISAVMDPLATLKTQIMGTSAYIEFGFNQDTSGAVYRLRDSRQNVSNVPSITTAKVDITGGNITAFSGVYVLTAVGANGGVTAYMLQGIQMRSLLNRIGSDIGTAISGFDTVEEVLQYFTANSLAQGSAVSAIRSCVWLPLSASIFPNDVQDVYLGDYNTYVHGRVLDHNQLFLKETELKIPWPTDDWKRMNCQLLLYLPFVGTVGIPVDQCNNATSLKFRWAVELITGGVSVRVNADDYTVYTGSANIGVPYAIGSSNIPIQNAVSGTISTIGGMIQLGAGSAAVGTGIASALWGGSEGISSGAMAMAAGASSIAGGIMQTLTPVVQCAGTLGGSAAVGQSSVAELALLYYKPIDDAGYQSKYGYPVMRVATPVAGYCKTLGFSLSADVRADEIAKVNALMDSGVFIE